MNFRMLKKEKTTEEAAFLFLGERQPQICTAFSSYSLSTKEWSTYFYVSINTQKLPQEKNSQTQLMILKMATSLTFNNPL